MGLSGSKSTDWVIVRDRLLFHYQPKNVVIHIGTNDINDNPILQTVDQYYATITSFLDLVLDALPETPVYYLGIEDRAGSAGGKNLYSEKVTAMIKDTYAPKHSGFTYVDSPSVFNADQAKYIRADNIHPSADGYAYYVKKLREIVSF
jgi:lysophospholipase L1-like esterase